ncbi:MAG: hypothetical protein ABH840_02285 [Nanoarchaeota archaeon]
MKITNEDRKRIQQKIADTYIPLKKLIFEDNSKEIIITEKNFTDYSHVLASVEMIIPSFVIANPKTNDDDILNALKKIRKNPLHEPSRSEEDALAFAITYGMSRALQQKRIAINEINALLDWLISEVEGRMQKNEGYIKWLKDFMKDSPIKAFRSVVNNDDETIP